MMFAKDSGRDCARAWEAMPWVLQGSAPPGQSEWLADHLARCEACRAEYAQQERLRHALSLPPDIHVDADAGLKRLLGRLDAPESGDPRVRQRPARWLTRALAAAVLLQALGLGALGAKLWSGATPQYHTLSQVSLPVPAGAIRVVPDSDMRLADWNGLLHAMQLRVVAGPNSVGAYTVVPTGPSSNAAHSLRQLRASRSIRLAEPIEDRP